MSIATPEQLATAIRGARLRREWTQAELADSIGVTREWVVRLEGGAPRLELDKVLRAAVAVGIRIVSPVDDVTAADIDRADEIAWDMALEGRPLAPEAYQDLLDKVVTERLKREADAAA